MESQIFRRVITDHEMYVLGPDSVSGVVNEAMRILNAACARYIADNLPHDAYQLLRIHREVFRDEPMARTVVIVSLDVGEVAARPRANVWIDEASPLPEEIRQWSQEYREELTRQHEAIYQDYINRRIIDSWRRLRERVQQAPDGHVAPIYGRLPPGSNTIPVPAQTEPPKPKEPEYTPIRRHICVAKQTDDA